MRLWILWRSKMADYYKPLTPEFRDFTFLDIRVEDCAQLISFGGLPERPFAQVLFVGLEADCGELIYLQDVSGLTIRNAEIRVQDDGIRLDGCRGQRRVSDRLLIEVRQALGIDAAVICQTA